MAIENSKKQTSEDLGLGDKVIQENQTRFLNKDGSFNVYRKGIFERGNFSPYHAVLNVTWPKFFFGVLGYYMVVNLGFSILYLFCGRQAFPDIAQLSFMHRFWQLFYYSIQVVSTLGSSPLHPATTASDILLALESMIGLFGFAVGASLMFARFSNPAAGIVFSQKAVIAPYKDITGFMVRIINGRSNELINLTATLTLSMNGKDGKRIFKVLSLERDSILVFPLNWTIVHPIDETSPLYNMSGQDLKNARAEFLLSITAVDQDLSKTLYIRTSYTGDEVQAGVKFTNIIERDGAGTVVVDPKRIGEIEFL